MQFIVLVLLVISPPCFAFERVNFEDKVDGLKYTYIGVHPNISAQQYCRNIGWDPFEEAYITDKQSDRFLEATVTVPELQKNVWTVKFSGEPGERWESGIWTQGDSGFVFEEGALFFDSSISSELKYNPKLNHLWIDEYILTNSPRHSFCMFLSETWYQCEERYSCTTINKHSPTTFKFEKVRLYGTTEEEAVERLVQFKKRHDETLAKNNNAFHHKSCTADPRRCNRLR